MIRKLLFLLVLVIVTLQLTACGAEKGHSAIVKGNGDSANQPYSVLSESYVIEDIKSDIKINYPQINGLSNVSTQNSVNSILKEEAIRITEVYKSDDDKVHPDVELKVDSVIKRKSERYISVQYFGAVYVQNTPHPTNLFYTTNIDLKNGIKVRLADLVKIDTELIEKFRNGRYIPFDEGLNLEKERVLTDLIERFTDEELINMFVAADKMDESNSSFTFSYFTENALGISIGIPHAVGDHLEIEIKFDDIKNLIKAEREIWKDGI
ncbi:hypothetical protein DRW41_07220 [Neobacillus piezotolerans]|uniref:DUF4163 domain-containing protein n=2 Tax=Neobacillus piezotolerans TaxID=2259171 RepID=A0A3D8GT44_9BACI|nr:hypothetical protein DRW41_07220 [Neobacillus piezotolerans]